METRNSVVGTTHQHGSDMTIQDIRSVIAHLKRVTATAEEYLAEAESHPEASDEARRFLAEAAKEMAEAFAWLNETTESFAVPDQADLLQLEQVLLDMAEYTDGGVSATEK